MHINRIHIATPARCAEIPPIHKETEVPSGWNPPQIEHIFQSNEDMTAAMDQDATLENQEPTRYPV